MRKPKMLAVVLAGAVLTGCATFGPGPWPSVQVDTTGLGNSAMAQVVRQHYMLDPERTIKRAALERLHAAAKGQPLTVEQASALGFTCETELVSCRWDGTLTEKFYANFRLRSRGRYEFSIRIVREDPLDLEVQAKRIEL